MDAFDQVLQEFAQTIVADKTNDLLSERERPACDAKQSIPPLSVAQQSASTSVALTSAGTTSKRRRQAKATSNAVSGMPAGTQNDQSESQCQRVDLASSVLGSDEGAQFLSASQTAGSPLVAQVSDDLKPAAPQSAGFIGGDEEAQSTLVPPISVSPLVSEIIQLWRMRQRWHRAEKSLILQGKALCRAWTAGDKDAANALHVRAEKREDVDPTVSMALMPFLAAQAGFSKERAAIEKRLRKLAQSSDLWPWVSEIKGFGPLNLAAVLGEAGEIANYRNPSCLWKRMGLAVIDGGRQRRVADTEKAILHGYAPARRCVAYLLGDTLIKSGDACRYRPVYTGRRERTAETHADWTKAHSHNDGARVMTKRVLRDLWVEARRLNRDIA